MTLRVPLVVATCDYRQTGAKLRSQLALDPSEQRALYEELASQGITGFVQLHTCNRLEWWVSAQDTDWACQLLRAAWRRRLSGFQGAVEPRLFLGEDAIEHVFRVSVGLESFVEGEREVRGQVRRALQSAQDAKHSSPALNIAAGAAGRLAAKVRHGLPKQTATPGMHSLVADLLGEQIPAGSTVLVVGMGEIGKRCASLLRSRGYRVECFNRSPDRKGSYRLLRHLPQALSMAPAVVFCSASPQPLLRNGVMPADRSLLVFDLGSPAQVEANLAKTLGPRYFGLDDLTTRDGVCLTSEAKARLEDWVDGAVSDYLDRLAHHRFRSLAQSNQAQLERVITDDLPGLLDRHASELSAKARRRLEHELRRLFRRQAWSIRESLVVLDKEEEPPPFRLPYPENETC